jgi:hypothetical protein
MVNGLGIFSDRHWEDAVFSQLVHHTSQLPYASSRCFTEEEAFMCDRDMTQEGEDSVEATLS